METQEVNNDPGNTVAVQSSELGLIYLVKDGEAQATLADFNKAIEAGKAAMDSVGSVNTDVLISTQGLLVGTYYAYAVDSYENISLKSDNAVQIIDISVPVVTITAQEINNAKGSAIDASMSEAGTIYLVLEGEAISSLEELEAANGTKGIQGLGETSVAISVEGITPGTYSAVAVDLAGNISAASTEKITVIKYVPSIRYYAVEDAPQLSADMVGANDGDVFVLTTNGGDYALEYWHKITAKITVMADENLTRRPVISNYRESSTYQTFRLYADGASLTLKGIEIDSKNHAVNPVKYMLRVESNIGRYSLVAEDCYFHGALKSTGTIVKTYGGTHADSIIFRDCIFEDSEAISMTGLSTEDSPSWDKLEISNCTFLNIPDAAINIKDQPSVNKAYPISVDHCTFYNTGDSLNSVISTDSMTHVSIRNSIFANSGSKTVANIYGDEVAQSSIDFCNYFESVAPIALGSGLVGTNVWSDDPQFADAPAGNLTLGNQTLYVLGGDGLPLGDLRWADVLGAKVLPEIMALSDSTLLVKFSEWIDTTSAIMPQNYTLSGSAGLTGIAKNVELYNFRSVLITCESFIGHVDKEVVITVSDVEDLKGNKVDAEHNTVIYVVEEMKPVVFANEQTVSNADGEIVLAQTSLASGYVYIILEGEAQGTVDDLNAAVQNLNGAKIAVTAAFVDIEILTFNITPGTYFAYFVDGSGMISEKGDNAITITDGIAPIVSAGIQSVDNANDSFVLVQSSESTGKVYIILDGEPQSKNADFITAVAFKNGAVSNVTEANVDVQLSTKGLTAGIYYAYAIDGKGNISEVGDSPINITDKTSIDIFDLSEINIYTKQQRIVVESDQVILKQVLIYNINGKLLERSSQIMQIFESGIYLPGLYIVSVRSVDNTIRNSKLVIN
jgi:hypothetical protein